MGTQKKPENSLALDWFWPAIEHPGTVKECLARVQATLEARSNFVAALQSRLVSRENPRKDTLTDLTDKIVSLEDTLKVRLGLLRPEREQAWFRVAAVQTEGPFASRVLREPVFADYGRHEAEQVRRSIRTGWKNHSHSRYMSKSPNLWGYLLKMNSDLAELTKLGKPYENFHLNTGPEELPPDLDSDILRGFIANVRNEYERVRVRLQKCYDMLYLASDELWKWQTEQLRESSRTSNDRARGAREAFRQRRARKRHGPNEVVYSPHDLQALEFMGFHQLPSSADLKKRYLEMAKRLHPDAEGGSEASFKLLSSAYNHLSRR